MYRGPSRSSKQNMLIRAASVLSNLQKLHYCTQNVNKKKLYSHTLFLPKTKFPLRLENKNLAERDERISSTPEFEQFYTWQRGHLSEPEFVLHDGPPYANGKLHMGHAINKILKDTILRYEILKGNKVNYVPGWDCHGLPIELKALSDSNLSPIEIRTKARKFAEAAIEEQKSGFKSWGVTGDWNNYYTTFKPDYYKLQFKIFHKLYKQNLIYRAFKPVYWSPSTRTALAEAELEYDENYKSPSAFVRVKINKCPNGFADKQSLYGLIWTTTPWTLPSNQGVCYNPSLRYSLVKTRQENTSYIVAADLIANLSETLNCNLEILENFAGETLANFTYLHPIFKERELSFLPAAHVTASKGTGLVHTAPAHGPDDFVVALNNKITINNLVDESGCYNNEAGRDLEGKFVLKDGTQAVIRMIAEDLVHLSEFVHSYPCDWRTKEPVIIKASQQWFMDTNAIKARAIDLLEDVKIFPKVNSELYKNILINQVKRRPYWCISRQRKWGVPIPVFLNEANGEVVINEDIIRHLCELVDKHGTDFWWKLPKQQLIPIDLQSDLNIEDLETSQDILDIWFDSGISWAHALDGNKVADMYLEGVDQFTGWFQSSLLTSVALRDKAPYRSLYVHGFAVDEKGMKMSKSRGNVVDPVNIMKGSKTSKAYGVDTLRWWVACHANQNSVSHVSPNVLQSSADEIQKIRSTVRFAIASLDAHYDSSLTYDNFSLLDKYMLHSLSSFYNMSQEAISEYQFQRICIGLNNLLTNTISALYYTGIKDRLYCDSIDSTARKASQFVLLQIFEIVTQVVAPIIPHMVEEMYSYFPLKTGKTYFTSVHNKPDDMWNNPAVEEVMDIVLSVKRQANKEMGADTTGYNVKINCCQRIWTVIKKTVDVVELQTEMEDILQVSQVIVVPCDIEDDFNLEISKSCRFLCPRCRRVQSESEDELCVRCNNVVKTFDNKTAVVN